MREFLGALVWGVLYAIVFMALWAALIIIFIEVFMAIGGIL